MIVYNFGESSGTRNLESKLLLKTAECEYLKKQVATLEKSLESNKSTIEHVQNALKEVTEENKALRDALDRLVAAYRELT